MDKEVVAIVEKLQELKDKDASFDEIYYYTKTFYHKLLSIKNNRNKEYSTRSVSVILPGQFKDCPVELTDADHAHSYVAVEQEDKKKEVKKETKVDQESVVEEPVDSAEYSSDSVPASEVKHWRDTEEDSEEEKVSEESNDDKEKEEKNEKPSDSHKDKKEALKEINERNKVEQLSWNDLLNKKSDELGSHLGNTSVKKLNQAIGINERFSFINELFRKDQSLYNRSLKTIDKCKNIDEAMYWINRELKIKLGWDDNDPTVQTFYALVKKRFSH